MGVLLLDLAEEVHKLLVTLSLSILDVLGVHLPALCGVVEDAGEVEDSVAYAGELLSGSGLCSQSPLSDSCSLTTIFYMFLTTLRGRLNL